MGFLLVAFVAAPALGQRVKRVGEIRYISKNVYYVTLGQMQGIGVGDTLTVKRNGRIVGRLVAEHVARVSSACRVVSRRTGFKKGDRVERFVWLNAQHSPAVPAQSQPAAARPRKPESRLKKRWKGSNARASRKPRNTSNQLSGRVSVESIWFDDMTRSNLNYRQVGLRTNLKVRRFLGMPLELRVRFRSRSHHRDRVRGSEVSRNEWTNNLYQFGLVYEDRESPVEFGFGRLISEQVRGLGYIDGGFVSMRIRGPWRVGVAGGTQPSLRNAGFQTNEQKVGFFVNYESGDYQSRRVSSTLAFSGRYHGGQTSREYIYLQNNISGGPKWSVYQTVELDVNRGWKRTAGVSAIQFSNMYVSAYYNPLSFLSLNVSFDARKNIRVYETRSIPDSLFDDATRQGLHSGLTLQLPHRIRLAGTFGIRFRSGAMQNTISASGALTARQIFNTWTTFTARLSYFSTMFNRGYRPSVNLRIPVRRGLSLNLAGGSLIYQTGTRTTRSNWVEANGYYRINRRLFADFGYRLFVDERLKSGRFSVELGVAF
ncbi:MAG: hypothetical protein D6743_04155 [Calditrichaeota bacterium]|nr:MAG: hypothetical protein D6743_04155 [Calditrichota bacterium]